MSDKRRRRRKGSGDSSGEEDDQASITAVSFIPFLKPEITYLSPKFPCFDNVRLLRNVEQLHFTCTFLHELNFLLYLDGIFC